MITNKTNRVYYFLFFVVLKGITLTHNSLIMSAALNDKLYEAVSSGDIKTIQAVLDQGAKINAKIYAGMTAVTIAARDGNARAMVYLIDQGAKVDSWAIHVAGMSRDSNQGIVKYLQLAQMKQVKPAVKGYEKPDAKLLRAAHSGRLNSVKKAIAEGANLNVSDDQDTSALRWASRWGHLDIVQTLLEAGADVNHQSNAKWTALMEAVMAGNEELVKLFIEKGANVNARTIMDASVLFFAYDIIPFLNDEEVGKRIISLLEANGAER